MEEESPLHHLLGFLKIVAALTLIIAGGVALVFGLSYYLRPETSLARDVASQPIVQLPEYKPETPPPPPGGLDVELAAAKAAYQSAKTGMKAALEFRQGAENPIAEDLAIVEGAVLEIARALTLNPDSESLKRALLGTYRREVRLLRKTLRIVEIEPEPEAVLP